MLPSDPIVSWIFPPSWNSIAGRWILLATSSFYSWLSFLLLLLRILRVFFLWDSYRRPRQLMSLTRVRIYYVSITVSQLLLSILFLWSTFEDVVIASLVGPWKSEIQSVLTLTFECEIISQFQKEDKRSISRWQDLNVNSPQFFLLLYLSVC